MRGSFRPAGAADLPALLEMSAALYAEDGTAPFDRIGAERALCALIDDDAIGEVWLVAGDGGAAEGYVVVCWGWSLEYGGRDAFIDELYVVPAARGRGVGRALVDLAEDRCRRRGIRAVHLEVERGNARARRLYERSGYADRGRHLLTKRL